MARIEAAGWFALAIAGVACELLAPGGLHAADLLTGLALIAAGVIARMGRGESRVGALLGLTAAVWFLGSIWTVAAIFHLGPLAQVLLSAPRGRLRGRVEHVVVAAAYADGILQSAQRSDAGTLAVACALGVTALIRWSNAGGIARRAWVVPLVATFGVSAVLAAGALGRLAGVGHESSFLYAYEIAVAMGTLAIGFDLARGGWAQSVVTGLVVDLGDAPSEGTLRDALAGALGDPTLEVGVWLPRDEAFVDESGARLTAPRDGRTHRGATIVEEDGGPMALVIHDAAVLTESDLVESVVAALRVAVANAGLRAEVGQRIHELEASRRRLIASADSQRQRLARSLAEGPEMRLGRVAELISGIDPPLDRELNEARAELANLAVGIHPSVLSERGLGAALEQLAARSPVAVTVTVDEAQLPAPMESALYFVCSEALANIAKHAGAHAARVAVMVENGLVRLVVSDDGVGGADPASGAGLRGLADRIEALDGRLSVRSVPGAGTTLEAEVPR
jgi:hypothetical protein